MITGHVYPFKTVDDTAPSEVLPTSEWHPTIGQPTAANSEEPIAVCDPSKVKPLSQPKYTLEGMLAGITEANLHEEIGGYVGSPKYRLLRTILDAAFNHAATGKGKERHARDLPFDDQPMLVTTRMVGPGFPLGQAIKKSQEAAGMIERGDLDAAEAECLGAINYLAGAVAWMRERKAIMTTKYRALMEACDKFARVANIVDKLPERIPDDEPARSVMPGVWPTVGDLRNLRDAMVVLGWKI